MATTGSIDVNMDNVSNAINGSTKFTGDALTGLASQGTSVGQILGIVILVVLVSMALAALLGLIKIPLGFVREFS